MTESDDTERDMRGMTDRLRKKHKSRWMEIERDRSS